MTQEKARNVVLITGMSGAGKTSAMNILEDMGYHCIDNFPVQLLSSLGKLIRGQDDSRYDYFEIPEGCNYILVNTEDMKVIFKHVETAAGN